MAVLFFFTATAHFNSMKHDLAAMIPPPLTGSLWLIYVTGVFEIAGASGLLIPRFRRAAAICLVRPATVLWLRTPLQLLWMAALWWSTIRGPAPEPAVA